MTLPGPETLVYAALIIAVILIAIIVARPAVTATRGGKIFAFVALFLLPVLCVFAAGDQHIERTKQTTFCLSCHIMEPYGKSLYVDSSQYVPAAHFQNHRIPVDEACYTCHTDYALYGGVRAKTSRAAPHLHRVSGNAARAGQNSAVHAIQQPRMPALPSGRAVFPKQCRAHGHSRFAQEQRNVLRLERLPRHRAQHR